MNSLLEALIKQGYKAKADENRIIIRLSWAAMPVLITRNIQQNVYELQLQYWKYVIVIIAFSFNALISVNLENSVSFILWGTLSLWYLGSAFLVHHKSRALQKYVDSINCVDHT
uniref:hypothetical protein n=1 Tax=Thaumasiovibrio occultus TaxID=1891184 RepID=UPI000B34CC7F|nr:hypothetical protein [Thaumasiovibrio occultus]